MSDDKAYYFDGRNTPVLAPNAVEARKRKKRGGDQLVEVRDLTDAEKKTARNGGWVRTRRDGQGPGQSSYGHGRGQGPPRSS